MMRQHVITSGHNQPIKSIFFISVLLLLLGASQAQVESYSTEGAWPGLRAARFVYFIENQGQLDRQVSHYLQGRDKTLYFTASGVTLALTGAIPTADAAERWVIKLDFVGGSARPVGQAPTETMVSYFLGPRDRWHTGLPTYARLVYPGLWPGIDLVYALQDNQLKYQFSIQPGADPAHIRLAYRGATSVRLSAAGQLEVSTPAGSFHDAAPYAYQVINGRRVPVSAVYELATPTTDGTYEYSFRLGGYDPALPLVLDPAFILYAGFIGGSQRDNGYSVALDPDGYAYVTGETHSIEDFPAVVGPDLSHNGGPYNGDAFIAKVRADGTGLVYAGFIGGTGEDYGYGVAVDADGYAYVTGQTASDNFPATPGAYDPTYNGGWDAFVAKVEADGTGLVYATYIGDALSPTASESGEDVAVDGDGQAYVLINTNLGPFSGDDTLVFKLNAAGSALNYEEFIGGSGDDSGDSLAVDADGYAYVTGETNSSDFPATLGAYDPSYNGGGDAFVAKVDADGTGLAYATYIGSVVSPTTIDSGAGIAVDEVGSAYVLVNTSSGPFGGYDTSVVKLNAAGSATNYVKYIGGSGTDFGSDLALDDQGQAYITGNTTSSTDFPTTNWPPQSYNAPQEAFAAQVSADGAGLVYAGFIAGSGTGSAGIAVDGQGNAYVTGTNWRGEDFPAVIGPDVTANGERDAFVVKISPLVYRTYLPLIIKSAAGG
jgi:hypothetical protein